MKAVVNQGRRTGFLVGPVWTAARVVVAVAGPALCLIWLLDLLSTSSGPLDLRVYRDVASAWRDGSHLYTVRVTEVNLPFTYPPFAAVLFLPLSLVPFPVVAAVWWIASVGCVYAVVWWSFQESAVTLLSRFAVAGALMASAPVWETIGFGQVNLFLLALVAADLLRRSVRFRGVLTGIATSIKVTPAFLLLLPLLRRDYRTVIRAAVTVVVVTVLVGMVLPEETVTYFGSLLWDTSRPGAREYVANQSAAGLLARTDLYSTTLWLAVCAAVVGCAIMTVTGPAGRSRVVGLFTVAIAGLLVSPISWAHHWVWICLGPAAATVLWRNGYRPEAITTVIFTALVAVWKPYTVAYITWSPEAHPTRWLLESNIYVWAAIAWLFLLAAFTVARRVRPAAFTLSAPPSKPASTPADTGVELT